MAISGFISEMSAEPIHGGGITLARVLGDELAGISWFAKILHFSSEQWPQYGSEHQNLVFPWWPIDSLIRPFIGSRRAHRFAYSSFIRHLFASNIASTLSRLGVFRQSTYLVCPQSDIAFRALDILQRKQSIDYITWIMDDHLLAWSNDRWFYPAKLRSLVQRHLSRARSVVVISEALRDYYRLEFGIESTVIHAPAPCPFPPTLSDVDIDGPLKLVYFGGLGPWQNDALELLLPFLRNGECILDIYTRQSHLLPPSLRVSSVRLLDPVSADHVQSLARCYHANVLPISFCDEMRNMSYFNIATKFSECLGGPIPTLLIGPSYAAMTKAASLHNAAFLATSTQPSALARQLEFLRLSACRRAIINSAHDFVRERMSFDCMRAKWHEACSMQ